MAQTVAQAKENIWVEINEAMTEIWPSIKIISSKKSWCRNQKKL